MAARYETYNTRETLGKHEDKESHRQANNNIIKADDKALTTAKALSMKDPYDGAETQDRERNVCSIGISKGLRQTTKYLPR